MRQWTTCHRHTCHRHRAKTGKFCKLLDQSQTRSNVKKFSIAKMTNFSMENTNPLEFFHFGAKKFLEKFFSQGGTLTTKKSKIFFSLKWLILTWTTRIRLNFFILAKKFLTLVVRVPPCENFFPKIFCSKMKKFKRIRVVHAKISHFSEKKFLIFGYPKVH